MACIYVVSNIINGKRYIGFTSNELKKRKYQHKQKSESNSPFAFHKAIRKYGWDNFEWEVIYESWDHEHCLTVMEPHFISEYNSFGENGYNMDNGGKKGMLGLKRKPLTEEQKKNISIGTKKNALKGKDHPMYGTKANENFIMSSKTSMLGKKHSDETRKRMSDLKKEYLQNNPSGMEGKSHSDETKYKMKLKRMGTWELYCKENKEKIIIEDLMKYCELNNLQYKTVYSWKYQNIDGIQRLTKV